MQEVFFLPLKEDVLELDFKLSRYGEVMEKESTEITFRFRVRNSGSTFNSANNAVGRRHYLGERVVVPLTV